MKNKVTSNNIIQKEALIKTLSTSLDSGIIATDERGEIVLVNQSFKHLFRLKKSSYPEDNKDLLGLLDPIKCFFKEPDKYLEEVKNFIAHKNLRNNKRFILSNGDTIVFESSPIYSGTVFIGQIWSFSQIKLENKKISVREYPESKYQEIIENMGMGLVDVGTDDKIIKVNNEFSMLTGHGQNKIIGEDISILLHPDDAFKIIKNNSDETKNAEVRIKKENGKYIYALVSKIPIYGVKETQIGNIYSIFSIDSQKQESNDLKKNKTQIEKARQAEKEFLANISHEIRNPLNSILGITNLLYDSKLNKHQRKHLTNVKYASEILNGIASKLLDISKIEKGKLRLTKEKINLIEMVNTLIQLESFNSNNENVIYKNMLALKEHHLVNADPTVINQIFSNLLNNASKFTKRGKIIIKGNIINVTKSFVNVEFIISDTGIGIKKSELKNVFEIFNKGNNETKLMYGGTGLGLGIVHKLVALYDGKIRVESKPNIGTSFIFNLRLQKFKKQNQKLDKSVYHTTKSKKLLVVEDNKINRYYLTEILKKLNVEYDVAENGLIGLENLKKNKYDLVLMDIQMPIMNGYETTINLRAAKTNQNNTIPVIALSASALVHEKKKALLVGFNDHITKPFSEKDLNEILFKYDIISEVTKNKSGKYVFSEPLNSDILKSLYGNDIHYMLEIFKLFASTMNDEFDSLKKHLKSGKKENFSNLAHKIKSSFAMVGLKDLADKMYELEQFKYDNDLNWNINLDFDKTEQKFKEGFNWVQNEIKTIKKFISEQETPQQ